MDEWISNTMRRWFGNGWKCREHYYLSYYGPRCVNWILTLPNHSHPIHSPQYSDPFDYSYCPILTLITHCLDLPYSLYCISYHHHVYNPSSDLYTVQSHHLLPSGIGIIITITTTTIIIIIIIIIIISLQQRRFGMFYLEYHQKSNHPVIDVWISSIRKPYLLRALVLYGSHTGSVYESIFMAYTNRI